jgi:hypothetical protein
LTEIEKMQGVLITKSPESFEKEICPKCGGNGGYWEVTKHPQHIGSLRCVKCGYFWRWIGKEKRAASQKLTAKQRNNQEEVCAFCGIRKDHAAKINRHFHSDHIIVLDFDGDDNPGNIWRLCSHCHYLKNSMEHVTRGITALLNERL